MLENTLRQFKKEFVDCIVDLDAKYYDAINEKFWDLIKNDVETRDDVNVKRKQRVNS